MQRIEECFREKRTSERSYPESGPILVLTFITVTLWRGWQSIRKMCHLAGIVSHVGHRVPWRK